MKRYMEFFPYETVRRYQDRLMDLVFEAASRGETAVIEGANGLGKTVAVLSALLPIAKEEGLTILYLSRTHKQMDRVIEELKEIRKRHRVTGVSIRGRREVCLHPLILKHGGDAKSVMDACKNLRAEGKCKYYENLTRGGERIESVLRLIEDRPLMASEIVQVCSDLEICPYEVLKAALGSVDVVSMSYLYMLDPIIRSSFLRYFDKPKSDFIVVLDEAHNLPDAALEVGSDSLSLLSVEKARKEAKDRPLLKRLCDSIEEFMLNVARRLEGEDIEVDPLGFVDYVERKCRIDAYSLADEALSAGKEIKRELIRGGKFPRSFLYKLGKFMFLWLETANSDAYIHLLSAYERRDGSVSYKLEVVAMDPRGMIADAFEDVRSLICISGTLQPIDAYCEICGIKKSKYSEALPSPFARDQIVCLVCKGVSTSLERREPEMYKKMVARIAEAVEYSPWNVGIFTASYEVLEGLLEAGIEDVIDVPLLVERKHMTSRENDKLIQEFKKHADEGRKAVLLGVQGGRNSEGEDYPGKYMCTSIVVGVPYAKPTVRVKAQIRYYEKQFPGRGKEYGYIMPALRKASQAAGRPVRKLDDRGAVILLDSRFATAYCRRYLPKWLRRNFRVLPDREGEIAKQLVLFFGFKTD